MLIRAIICAAIGVFTGGAAGALILGWDASMAVGSSWIGPTRDFWPLAAYVGGLAGAAFGLSLGLYLCLAGIGMRGAAIAGAVIGLIGVMVLLSNPSGGDSQLRSMPSQVGPMILSLIIWTLLGLLIGSVSVMSKKLG